MWKVGHAGLDTLDHDVTCSVCPLPDRIEVASGGTDAAVRNSLPLSFFPKQHQPSLRYMRGTCPCSLSCLYLKGVDVDMDVCT